MLGIDDLVTVGMTLLGRDSEDEATLVGGGTGTLDGLRVSDILVEPLILEMTELSREDTDTLFGGGITSFDVVLRVVGVGGGGVTEVSGDWLVDVVSVTGAEDNEDGKGLSEDCCENETLIIGMLRGLEGMEDAELADEDGVPAVRDVVGRESGIDIVDFTVEIGIELVVEFMTAVVVGTVTMLIDREID